MVFQCINIRQVTWEVLKTAAFGLGFNTSHGTWRMLMHAKPCLIPILELRNLWRTVLLERKKTVQIKGGMINMSMLILSNSLKQYNKSYSMRLPNFKIIGRVVPEKKFTHRHTDKQCYGKYKKNLYTLYRLCIPWI